MNAKKKELPVLTDRVGGERPSRKAEVLTIVGHTADDIGDQARDEVGYDPYDHPRARERGPSRPGKDQDR